MSNRHRLPHAALGGCLAVFLGVSLALAQEPQKVVPPVLKSQPKTEGGQQTDKGEPTDQGQKKEPAPEKLSPSLNRIESAIRDLIAQQRAAQGKGPEQHEISDLKAQEGMAFWAKTMFWATVAAVVITFIGILLIKRTLEETKRAAIATEGMLDEAKETTKAAQAAVEVTSKTAERQLRPYIHVSIAHIKNIEDPDKREVVFIIKNYGQTPAFHMICKVGVGVKEWPLMTGIKDFPEDMPYGVAPMPPSRSSEMFVPVPDLSKWEEKELQAGRAAIYCYGEVTYDDGFSPVRRYTNFRLACHGEMLAKGRLSPCKEGNEAT